MIKMLTALMGFTLLASSSVLAQAPSSQMRDRLETDLNSYAQATISQNVESIIAFTHPVNFETISKEKMAAVLKDIFASRKAPVIKKIDFTDIGKIQPFSKGHFAVATYSVQMSLQRPGDSSPELDKMLISMIKDEFGETTQVVVNEKAHNISITRNNIKMFAIKDAEQTGWKMIAEDRLPNIKAGKLLPADLLEKLKPKPIP